MTGSEGLWRRTGSPRGCPASQGATCYVRPCHRGFGCVGSRRVQGDATDAAGDHGENRVRAHRRRLHSTSVPRRVRHRSGDGRSLRDLVVTFGLPAALGAVMLVASVAFTVTRLLPHQPRQSPRPDIAMASPTVYAQIAGSPFAVGGATSLATAIAYSSTGLAATTIDGTPGTVAVFTVAPSGALTPVAASPFPAGTHPRGLAFSPDGSLLAVTN